MLRNNVTNSDLFPKSICTLIWVSRNKKAQHHQSWLVSEFDPYLVVGCPLKKERIMTATFVSLQRRVKKVFGRYS